MKPSPGIRAVARSLASAGLIFLGGLLPAGCQSGPRVNPLVARFYLEVRPGEAGVVLQLPLSKTQVLVNSHPVLSEYDISAVEYAKNAQVGWGLIFRFKPAAAQDLYRLSSAAIGRHFALTFNGTPIGVALIDQPVRDGAMFLLVELEPGQLPEVADRIARTSGGLAGRGRRER